MYICPDCGCVFDESEVKVWTENHGLPGGFHETFYGCPECGSGYEEAYYCEECEEWFALSDMYDQDICIACAEKLGKEV